MGGRTRLLEKVLRGTSDANIPFDSLCGLLRELGFDGVVEILNLQPKNNKAKPYQVRQVRNVIIRYRLAGDDDND